MVATDAPGPTSSFLRAWKGDASQLDDRVFPAVLTERLERARTTWPELAWNPSSLSVWLGERTATHDAVAGLRALHVDDLYLCHGCALGDARAVRAFELAFVARVPSYLASMRPAERLIEATQQDLRIRLLVNETQASPKIGQYRGTGPLDGWLRVVATRIASRHIRNHTLRNERSAADEHGAEMASGVDLETDFAEAHHHDALQQALREAFAGLSARARELLRLHLLESLSAGRICERYAVHRTTVTRWLIAAEHELGAHLRAIVRARMRVSEKDCDHLLDVLRRGNSIDIGFLAMS